MLDKDEEMDELEQYEQELLALDAITRMQNSSAKI